MNIKKLAVILVCFLIGSLRLYGMEEIEILTSSDTSSDKKEAFLEKIISFQQYHVMSMEWGNFSNYLAVAVSKSSNHASCPGFESVLVIEPVSGESRIMQPEITSLLGLKWSFDDKLLFAFGDKFVYTWDVYSGKLIYSKSFENPVVTFDLTYSYFAVAFENEIKIFSYFGDLLRNLDLQAHNIKINFGDFITFSHNESFISIYSYEEKRTRIFNIGAGEFVYTVDDTLRKRNLHSWAFPPTCKEPDCFQDGILSSDKKFQATAPCLGKKGTLLPRHIIKITSLS